jgi:hypothetical protein
VSLGKNLRCWPGIDSQKRTHELYKDHVQLSAPNNSYKGIKDRTFLSDLITLPQDALIDDMHCSDEGVTKQLLKLWFSTKNHKFEFYLQSQIHSIDSILKLVKYPKEIKRNQKSITLATHYHANEYRALSSYVLIYIVKGKFYNENYYFHLIKYLLFLRLIRQELVSKEDLKIAQLLINTFVEAFPDLYGTKNTTHNLHSNLHLPEQIAQHGNKCNAYPGENCFKQLKPNVYGPTHITRQIAINASVQNNINQYLTQDESTKIEKFELRNLYNKLISIKNENHTYLNQSNANLVDPISVQLENLLPPETKLLLEYFDANLLQNEPFQTSLKLFYNNTCE